MKRLNKRILLVIGFDLGMLVYLGVLLLAFTGKIGKPDESSQYMPVTYKIDSSVIQSYSHLVNETEFHYSSDTQYGVFEIIFSTSGDSASIGPYEPHTYLYSTSGDSIYISFEQTESKLYKVTFDEIVICDEDGEHQRSLNYNEYTYGMKDGKGICKYTKASEEEQPIEKYIYSVSLSFYVKK